MDLTFITDPVLQDMIERDIKEVEICQEHGAHKATMVLAGSVVEAVLVDHFLANVPKGVSREKVLRADLRDLIEWAEKAGLVSAQIRSVADGVRLYRNVIHPGRELREQQEVSLEMAQAVLLLMRMVFRALSEELAKNRGPTYEQVLGAASGSYSPLSVVLHSVDKMLERDKLRLFHELPKGVVASWYEDDLEAAERLITVSRHVARAVSASIRDALAKVRYRAMCGSGTFDVLVQLCLSAGDLGCLPPDEMRATGEFLLSGLGQLGERDFGVLERTGVVGDLVKVLSLNCRGLLEESLWTRMLADDCAFHSVALNAISVDEGILLDAEKKLARVKQEWAQERVRWLRESCLVFVDGA